MKKTTRNAAWTIGVFGFCLTLGLVTGGAVVTAAVTAAVVTWVVT